MLLDEVLLELTVELLLEVIEELLVELMDELLELVDETTLELLDDGDGFAGDVEPPPPPHPTIVPPEMAKHKYRPIFDRIILHLWLLLTGKKLAPAHCPITAKAQPIQYFLGWNCALSQAYRYSIDNIILQTYPPNVISNTVIYCITMIFVINHKDHVNTREDGNWTVALMDHTKCTAQCP